MVPAAAACWSRETRPPKIVATSPAPGGPSPTSTIVMSIVTRPTTGTSAPSSSTTRGGKPGELGVLAGGPEKAVGVAERERGDRRRARGAPGGAVAHGLAGADRAHRHDARPERGHRPGRRSGAPRPRRRGRCPAGPDRRRTAGPRGRRAVGGMDQGRTARAASRARPGTAPTAAGRTPGSVSAVWKWVNTPFPSVAPRAAAPPRPRAPARRPSGGRRAPSRCRSRGGTAGRSGGTRPRAPRTSPMAGRRSCARWASIGVGQQRTHDQDRPGDARRPERRALPRPTPRRSPTDRAPRAPAPRRRRRVRSR